jgi:hypothetical protein
MPSWPSADPIDRLMSPRQRHTPSLLCQLRRLYLTLLPSLHTLLRLYNPCLIVIRHEAICPGFGFPPPTSESISKAVVREGMKGHTQ